VNYIEVEMFFQKKKAKLNVKSADYYIIGLGNKGKKYEHTRHNAGFDVVNILAQTYNAKFVSQGNILYSHIRINGKNVMLVLPQTYMNRSGEALDFLFKKFGANINNIIVIYDDVDLELGKIRIKERGSAGTHNGMRSIIYALGNDEFLRIRVGIGKPEDDIIEHVLSEYSDSEMKIAFDAYMLVAKATETIVEEGVSAAQMKFN